MMFGKIKNEYRATFDLVVVSPVLVRTGQQNDFDPTRPDMQFLTGKKDGDDCFVIPGSSIKGVFRHFFYEKQKNEEYVGALFGTERDLKKPIIKSRIRFFDAYSLNDTVIKEARYNVKIDKILSSAQNKALFSPESLIAGRFETGITILNPQQIEIEDVLEVIREINEGQVRFGAAVSRGYGQMKVENYKASSYQYKIENGNFKEESKEEDIEF